MVGPACRHNLQIWSQGGISSQPLTNTPPWALLSAPLELPYAYSLRHARNERKHTKYNSFFRFFPAYSKELESNSRRLCLFASSSSIFFFVSPTKCLKSYVWHRRKAFHQTVPLLVYRGRTILAVALMTTSGCREKWEKRLIRIRSVKCRNQSVDRKMAEHW